MIHTCHAIGCRTAVPFRLLMCSKHWASVPRDLQRDIWDTYRRGQENDKRPSHAYMAAFWRAVAAVARLEGRVAEADACLACAERRAKVQG